MDIIYVNNLYILPFLEYVLNIFDSILHTQRISFYMYIICELKQLFINMWNKNDDKT